MSGPPKAVARMLTTMNMIVRQPIAALYLRIYIRMKMMIVIAIVNSHDDDHNEIGTRLYLWHEAKSFLRQVIRSTISTIEATTFVSR